MKPDSPECVVFQADELLPEPWQRFSREGPVRTFNPGLLRAGAGWLFAYRVVGPDGRRRIGLCRLDRELRVVASSPRALTDRVQFPRAQGYPEIATQWFADPRLYRLQGRTFVYWNTGWHEPQNFQFLQEFDSRTLDPLGPPRELVLKGPRQKLEKNWTLFEEPAGGLRAIYTVLPHRVLEFSLAGERELVFTEIAATAWSLENYPPSHGGLRGGAPPQLMDGAYWSFCHSVHDGPDGYRYAPALYRFASTFPYAPTEQPITLLDFGDGIGNERLHERLNPAVGPVLYPCGAAWDGVRWLVSYGINDERCAIAAIAAHEAMASLRPVERCA